MMKAEPGLGGLLERGGVYYGLGGGSVREVLDALIKAIPSPGSRDDLLRTVLEREALMSTGMGGGIAIPHPRTPAPEKNQFAALAFLENPVDWKAPDGIPVDTLLLVVSASAKFHLKTLSAISFLCMQDEFRKLLAQRASQEKIIGFINETEQKWKEEEK